ncbi:hypothetical protein AGMMS50256_01590 [Betaproteobacteria bacterium]|nr:hypothetical protein AGMMS50256_01590 [Betaproteobacteria bacterium]
MVSVTLFVFYNYHTKGIAKFTIREQTPNFIDTVTLYQRCSEIKKNEQPNRQTSIDGTQKGM